MSDEVQDTPSAEEAAAAKAKAAAAAAAKAEAAAKAKAAHEAAEAAKEIWERDPVPPEWEDADEDPLTVAVRRKHPVSIQSARTMAGDLTLEVRRPDVALVCGTLKEQGYILPVDICGAHYPDRETGRFEVVYHLYSFEANRRIRLKVRTDEGEAVPTVTSVWVAANWPEREAYDMYGIRFDDHPDMTRILLWEGFNGYPLRKDFPVEGIDTGSAIYPEYYGDEAGPVAGTGTGWKPPQPPEPPAEEPAAVEAPIEEATAEKPRAAETSSAAAPKPAPPAPEPPTSSSPAGAAAVASAAARAEPAEPEPVLPLDNEASDDRTSEE